MTVIKVQVVFTNASDGDLFVYEQEMEVQDGATATIRFNDVEMATESLDSVALILPLKVSLSSRVFRQAEKME